MMLRTRTIDGFSYVEVLVASIIIAIALAPSMDALYSAMSASEQFTSAVDSHYRRVSKLEEVLAEPYASLLLAAEAAGDADTPTLYSDGVSDPDRRMVYLALYDGDADPFTIVDPDIDGDANPFTGWDGLLWVQVADDERLERLETLTRP
jgi:type II secretory pathway component PulJ